MSDKTKIEWCDATWNPLRGCSRVSEGCRNCYAEGVAARFSGPGLPYEGLAKRVGKEARWTGKVVMASDDVLTQPLRWKRPRRIFVNSMSDLFHENVPDEWIARIYGVAIAAFHLRGHTLQVLTKRAARMHEVLGSSDFWDEVNTFADMHVMERVDPLNRKSTDARASLDDYGPKSPPPGIWLGVSIEDQKTADARVPDLLNTPAAVRFISAEPLLAPVDLSSIDIDGYTTTSIRPYSWKEVWESDWAPEATGTSFEEAKEGYIDEGGVWPPTDERPRGIDWVIVGGESGSDARPMHPDWARSIRDQCHAADVPFFFKQWGEYSDFDHIGEAWNHLPEHVRTRQMFVEGKAMIRVGKKAAGDLLDGVQHHNWPVSS